MKKDEIKELKYLMYLSKKAILEEKKKLINYKTRLNELETNQTRTRKLNNKKK